MRKINVEYWIGDLVAKTSYNLNEVSLAIMQRMYEESKESNIRFEVSSYEE